MQVLHPEIIMVSVEALQAFLAVVDCKSFSAAAESLEQTPSSISRSVSRLENHLGVRLLNRTTRKLDLTDEGRWLVERGRGILQSLKDTEAELTNSFAHPSGLLRINSSTPVFTQLITPLIAGFLNQYPAIRLEFISDESVVDLLDKQANIAIRVGELSDSTLNARRLAGSRMMIVASPDYLQRSGIPSHPSDLISHTLLGFKQPSSLNLWPLMDYDREGVVVEPVVRCSNGEVIRSLTLAGAGIACLSDFFVQEDVHAGRLEPLLTEYHSGWRKDIWAVFYKSGFLPARMQVFVDYLHTHIEFG